MMIQQRQKKFLLWGLLLLVLLLLLGGIIWLVARSGSDSGSDNDQNFPSEARLYLTPYIASGNISEGQQKARVPPELFKNVESYSGFLTVNKTYNSNLFFWYFPPMNQNASAPVILWLNGGPGSSSMTGLFTINGPFLLNDNFDVSLNEHSWSNYYHMLYIDQPVGAGYSFTDSEEGYTKNRYEYGSQLYEAVSQFFDLFPNLRENEFFAFGESYGGKYIPALGHMIFERRDTDKKINLKGLGIGNGTPDPYNQIFGGDFFYAVGLLDDNQFDILQSLCEKFKGYIKQELWNNATNLKYKILEKFQNYSGYTNLYNFLHVKAAKKSVWKSFVIKEHIRRAMHVGDAIFDQNEIVKKYLSEDQSKSVNDWLEELLSHYPVLLYNGQLDMLTPYPVVMSYVKTLNFSAAEEYKVAKRCHWMVDDELAGYYKVAGNLTEVLVRNSGHMVPKEQPVWMLNLLANFINKNITNCS